MVITVSNSNREHIVYPRDFRTKNYCFGDSAISDYLSFGFSYIEQKDHCVDCILLNPSMMKDFVKGIEDLKFVGDKDYIGFLWTAKVYITERVPVGEIIFSNADESVVLCLDIT